MPRRLTQQLMTLSDLQWPFQASRAISAVYELLVVRGFTRHLKKKRDQQCFVHNLEKFKCIVVMFGKQS